MEIIAHRGASYLEPENTLRSVKRAIALGADWVEVDVRQSRDGQLVIMHDPQLERTTNGKGLLKDKTLSQLKKLDAGKGEEIPTLTEVIDTVKGRVGLVIEIKVLKIEEQVVDLLHHKGRDKVIITSFYHALSPLIKKLDDQIATGIIFRCHPLKTRNLARDAEADVIFPHLDHISRDMVEEVQEAGIRVYPWLVDEEPQLKRMKSWKVDGVVTNRLIHKKKLLNRFNGPSNIS
jgi:glycerophosphoryl diester phosphodiesterase